MTGAASTSVITVVPMWARADSCCRGHPVGFEHEVGVVRPRLHLQRSAALRVVVVEQMFGVAANEHLTDAHAFADPEPVAPARTSSRNSFPDGGGAGGDDGRV